MNKRKSARPDVGASERAKESGAACRQATNSKNDCTTVRREGQGVKIADLLHYGRENAVTLRDLEALTGLDGRTIRQMIERARRDGVLIVSDNQHGYWLTDDPAEAQRFARSMRGRAHEILTTAACIEVAAGID